MTNAFACRYQQTMFWHVLAFYEFARWSEEQACAARACLERLARSRGVAGLCVTGEEGLNGTCAAQSEEAIRGFLEDARRELGLNLSNVKASRSKKKPFEKFRAPIRREIVTLGDPQARPSNEEQGSYVSPEEWDALAVSSDAFVLDTRNWYETKIGKFRGAVELGIETFQEFGVALERASLPKDKTALIYCTGGIRCEKAIVEMKRQGFQDVRQLEGGILRYLERRPRSRFEGECFVFDRRVAVDQDLVASARYEACAHCGQPSEERIACLRCGTWASVCESCSAAASPGRTCSKNCAHHWRLSPGKRGRQQDPGRRQGRRRPSEATRS